MWQRQHPQKGGFWLGQRALPLLQNPSVQRARHRSPPLHSTASKVRLRVPVLLGHGNWRATPTAAPSLKRKVPFCDGSGGSPVFAKHDAADVRRAHFPTIVLPGAGEELSNKNLNNRQTGLGKAFLSTSPQPTVCCLWVRFSLDLDAFPPTPSGLLNRLLCVAALPFQPTIGQLSDDSPVGSDCTCSGHVHQIVCMQFKNQTPRQTFIIMKRTRHPRHATNCSKRRLLLAPTEPCHKSRIA